MVGMCKGNRMRSVIAAWQCMQRWPPRKPLLPRIFAARLRAFQVLLAELIASSRAFLTLSRSFAYGRSTLME